jgi:hypothetical protein
MAASAGRRNGTAGYRYYSDFDGWGDEKETAAKKHKRHKKEEKKQKAGS